MTIPELRHFQGKKCNTMFLTIPSFFIYRISQIIIRWYRKVFVPLFTENPPVKSGTKMGNPMLSFINDPIKEIVLISILLIHHLCLLYPKPSSQLFLRNPGPDAANCRLALSTMRPDVESKISTRS